MAIKEVDQKSYDELIYDLQHRYGRLRTRFDLHIVGEDESPSELAELKGLIESLNVEDENLNKKIDEINKRFETIEVGDIDLSDYVKKSELPDLLPETGHLLTESEASDLYVKKTEIPQPQDLSEYAKKSELPDTSNLLTESEASELYAKKTDIPQPQDLTDYAKKSELPDTSNLLTEYQADAKYVLNSEMVSYARKTDIPQPQDLTEYAKKSEIVEPDLTPYVKKSELTQPDLEPYETKEHAVQTYVNKSELPDLSIYALKSELANLPQGGTSNVTPELISRLLTTTVVTSYDQIMDNNLVFVNESDKPVTITVQEYDKTQPYPYPLVDKEYTFQPREQWEVEYGKFNPQKQSDSYPQLIVTVDGERINIRQHYRQWPLKAYLKPEYFMSALNGGLEFKYNQYNFLTNTKLEEMLGQDYNFESYGVFKNLATKTYVDSKLVKPTVGAIYVYDGSTLKATITPDKSSISGDRGVLIGSVKYFNGYSSLGKNDKYQVRQQIGSNIDDYNVTIESIHSVSNDNNYLEGFNGTYAAVVVKFGYSYIRDVVLK